MLTEVHRLTAWELKHAIDLLKENDPKNGANNILDNHAEDIKIWLKLAKTPLMRPYKSLITNLQAQLESCMDAYTSLTTDA
ncbi:hypothetical protein OC834_007933 [Tilletia horrida]|nr:hypothetical protein OC834_007933 [Tilletia horrida]